MNILVVDEGESYCIELVNYLQGLGHRVEVELSSQYSSPLQILEQRKEKVDVLIVHSGMMDQAQALTFCRMARQLWPNAVIVVDGIGTVYKSVADFVGVRPGPNELNEMLAKSAGR